MQIKKLIDYPLWFKPGPFWFYAIFQSKSDYRPKMKCLSFWDQKLFYRESQSEAEKGPIWNVLWLDCNFLICKHCNFWFVANQKNWLITHFESKQTFFDFMLFFRVNLITVQKWNVCRFETKNYFIGKVRVKPKRVRFGMCCGWIVIFDLQHSNFCKSVVKNLTSSKNKILIS